MSISVTLRPFALAVVIVSFSIFCCNSGKAYNGDVPQTGAGGLDYEPYTGAGGLGGQPYSGSGGVGSIPQTGGAGVFGDDPAEIVAKALLCFNERHIYSSCADDYRLTESGNLNVPPDYVDEYCNGPCLTETHLVLNCIENIMTHFLFYNKASIYAVRGTIKAGCSYGPERGDFNVAEHLQYEENSAYFSRIQILFGLGFAFILHTLLL
ncbi:uncharacterized protein LOC126667530 [Mercurialis annua]|uniref:uncharacterized protein LOC126667530 n=1 Tax=Mercurialis annua TaxID=3986 RepID=UPI0024ADEC8A|nr:uncharacterized protein LOC126667530 [Mercurialis annua]